MFSEKTKKGIIGYNNEKIAQLESQLTGDMFSDMNLKDQIHKLKLEEAGGSCSIDDPECEACGS